jgi:hypothetical protein
MNGMGIDRRRVNMALSMEETPYGSMKFLTNSILSASAYQEERRKTQMTDRVSDYF